MTCKTRTRTHSGRASLATLCCALSAALACGGPGVVVDPGGAAAGDDAARSVDASSTVDANSADGTGNAGAADGSVPGLGHGRESDGSRFAEPPEHLAGDEANDSMDLEPPVVPEADRWQLAMTRCPAAADGSLADVWSWAPPAGESDVLALDLHGDGTTFDLLADYEGTSIIVRVRDADSGDARAVIKTNSSNTRVTAEIYAYRLAVFLGFEHLVPPTSPVAIDGGALEKMRDLLADTSYPDDYKERARQQVVRELDAALADGVAYEGALKPWLGAFMFIQSLGERDRLVNHAVMPHLLASGPQPGGDEVELVQITRLYSPNGTHRGRLSMADLAEDLSNLMVMDALMGQNDRFAGANLHFQAVSGEREQIGERRGMPEWDLGAVRLLALDNGAALRARHGTGMSDLVGGVMAGTRIERFEPETVERLRALGRRAIGYGCDTAPFDDEVDAIWSYLGIEDADRRARAAGLLEDVLTYIDGLEASHGDDAFLAPGLEEPLAAR